MPLQSTVDIYIFLIDFYHICYRNSGFPVEEAQVECDIALEFLENVVKRLGHFEDENILFACVQLVVNVLQKCENIIKKEIVENNPELIETMTKELGCYWRTASKHMQTWLLRFFRLPILTANYSHVVDTTVVRFFYEDELRVCL